jgi:hypothetical protein
MGIARPPVPHHKPEFLDQRHAEQVLKEAFNLSDGGEKFIVNGTRGQGIPVMQEGRILFYFTTFSATKR